MRGALEEAERALYEDVYETIPDIYGANSPGIHFLPVFLSLVGDRRGSLLDVGCATGKAGLRLAREGFDVSLCDLTDAGLVDEALALPFRRVCAWQSLEAQLGQTYDDVCCCDVLEHLPTQFTMLAVEQMLRVARHGVFLSVCFSPDNLGIWLDRPLHSTVQPFTWWRDSLRELGTLTDARDLLTAGTFYLTPRSGVPG